ncbi:MAG: CoB--CoM heterodisulfide reductase iron-sulfur subunit B family protein [Firmicutes bacterium]|nr:CoB--CoM heterodisulfide reductase iron-sulfur subunit B family protein [Bacillota bacterium]
MKYAYYPGCVAEESCSELDQAMHLVAAKLSIDLVPLEEATCCGARDLSESEPEVGLALNARNLALAEAKGLNKMLTICNTCTLTLSEANLRLKTDGAAMAAANKALAEIGMSYRGTVNVTHFLWVLLQEYGLDNLKKRVVRPLNGLRVAPFYGCHILRPAESLGFESAEKPTSLAKVIEALGGRTVPFAGEKKCCGFHIVAVKESTSHRMAGRILSEAADEGADCMVTPCPLCHLSVDAWQGKAGKAVGRNFSLPVFHLPQLIGLALGLSASQLGLGRHLVGVGGVLQRLGAA